MIINAETPETTGYVFTYLQLVLVENLRIFHTITPTSLASIPIIISSSSSSAAAQQPYKAQTRMIET